MNCRNCGAAIPEAAMFCPECGTDVRASEADGDAAEGDEARADDAVRDGTSEDEFDWGGGEGDERGEWGVDERAAGPDVRASAEAAEVGGSDEGAGAGDSGTEDSPGDGDGTTGPQAADEDDADDEPFPEPTRLSRPADSRHPEPVMGTHDEVVGHRIGAFVVDRILLWTMFVAPVVAAAVLTPLVGESGASLLALLGLGAAFVAALVYAFVLEGLYGQTPGKRLLGIVVVKEDGEPCTYGASVVRSLLWMVDRYFLGMVALGLVLATDRSQRFGDIVADTVVVKAA